MDAARRVGQPVVVRHRWNEEDFNNGLAIRCPACYDPSYGNSRSDCPVCFGVTFVSAEFEPSGTLYINTQGEIQTGDPGTHVRAPRYGGFAEPFLTWLIEPDVAVDVFRINEQGVFVRTYDAQGAAPWYPTLGDNDLCTNVDLEADGQTIRTPGDRFLLKMVQQITVRGFGKKSRNLPPANQPYLCSQSFRMNKLPVNDPYWEVPLVVA